MDDAPVFYDPSGRRRRRFTVAVAAFVLLLLLAGGIFAASIITVAPRPELPFELEHQSIRGLPAQEFHQSGRRHSSLDHMLRRATRWMAAHRGPGPANDAQLSIAFYAPWDDASNASLARHINQLDWLIPGWLSITGPDHRLTSFPDPHGKALISAAIHRPILLPMVQNAIDGVWDGAGMAALLHDPQLRKNALRRIDAMLRANRANGVFFDFEDLPPSAHDDYRLFLGEARQRFGPRGWIVAIAVPVDNPDWNLKAYAAVADRLFLMAYDEHYQGGSPGPIASRSWFVEKVAHAAQGVDRNKLVVAVGSYAYDWASGGQAEALSVEEAWLEAHESDVMPVFDPVSGNSHFSYVEGKTRHDVWTLDAAATHDQIANLRTLGLGAVALWRLGTEDPSVWQLIGKDHRRSSPAKVMEIIPPGTNVDIEGNGEILRIGSTPVPGRRKIDIAPNGLIADERFINLPLPYTIERTGYRPGLVALTFDDGPDTTWTPKILDILKAEHVHATFFVVGENALTRSSLLTRLVHEGHDVGSHTYTHPNLAQASARETELELNATQRLFQAFTGRSLTLFRAPFFGDAEPTTADEIVPIEEAQRLGYLSVGLHVDPNDWKRPGVQAIIDQTIAGVEASNSERSGQVVLLHDAGGDRSQTVKALPAIIHALREKGYRFVRISELAGLQQSQIMPVITRSDRFAAIADLALFSALGGTVIALKWLFAIAISIGIARAVLLSALALWQARIESRTVFPPIDSQRFVTVLIPAFNEERVIEHSVRRVLASENVRIEVIVIDDGSKDRTSEIVDKAFRDDGRVALLTLQNGGKARALNEGLKRANGDIVIALDADTQFESLTVARLARWFSDPAIGAVAGNAKVGNRINLATRWQALEYITAQNLERRALARLDAMTVVPGAVGAWRLEALLQLGGYPADTLAEDQDLTISIQRAGWKVTYDQYAVAWTEAPETFAALARQRFRWAYGTLQCLWKHHAAIAAGQPRGLARIGLPQVILFQVLFAAISPVIDLALIASMLGTYFEVEQHGWAQTQTDLDRMLTYWLVFTLIDLLAGVIAFALERRERWRLLWLMIPQRMGYRQIMYYVVIKALTQAVRGLSVGWGKLERSGRVSTSG